MRGRDTGGIEAEDGPGLTLHKEPANKLHGYLTASDFAQSMTRGRGVLYR